MARPRPCPCRVCAANVLHAALASGVWSRITVARSDYADAKIRKRPHQGASARPATLKRHQHWWLDMADGTDKCAHCHASRVTA